MPVDIGLERQKLKDYTRESASTESEYLKFLHEGRNRLDVVLNSLRRSQREKEAIHIHELQLTAARAYDPAYIARAQEDIEKLRTFLSHIDRSLEYLDYEGSLAGQADFDPSFLKDPPLSEHSAFVDAVVVAVQKRQALREQSETPPSPPRLVHIAQPSETSSLPAITTSTMKPVGPLLSLASLSGVSVTRLPASTGSFAHPVTSPSARFAGSTVAPSSPLPSLGARGHASNGQAKELPSPAAAREIALWEGKPHRETGLEASITAETADRTFAAPISDGVAAERTDATLFPAPAYVVGDDAGAVPETFGAPAFAPDDVSSGREGPVRVPLDAAVDLSPSASGVQISESASGVQISEKPAVAIVDVIDEEEIREVDAGDDGLDDAAFLPPAALPDDTEGYE